MCLGGHLALRVSDLWLQSSLVGAESILRLRLTLVCWRRSATSQLSESHLTRERQSTSLIQPSVHSATLGEGKSDDTLLKVRNGDLKGKGEITMVFGKQVSQSRPFADVAR